MMLNILIDAMFNLSKRNVECIQQIPALYYMLQCPPKPDLHAFGFAVIMY